jgi:hypothetical protein
MILVDLLGIGKIGTVNDLALYYVIKCGFCASCSISFKSFSNYSNALLSDLSNVPNADNDFDLV